MTFTNTQIRTAILRAADHIEARPESYDFWSRSIPDDDCGTHGCMWGWIGYFLGVRGTNWDAATACGFKARADGAGPTKHLYEFCKNLHSDIPRQLRAYADAHFPAEPNNLDPAFLRFRESLTGVVCG